MHANAPPNAKRGPAKTALRDTELQIAYRVATLLAKAFARPFWFFEQKRSRLMDWIDREGCDQ